MLWNIEKNCSEIVAGFTAPARYWSQGLETNRQKTVGLAANQLLVVLRHFCLLKTCLKIRTADIEVPGNERLVSVGSVGLFATEANFCFPPILWKNNVLLTQNVVF